MSEQYYLNGEPVSYGYLCDRFDEGDLQIIRLLDAESPEAELSTGDKVRIGFFFPQYEDDYVKPSWAYSY